MFKGFLSGNVAADAEVHSESGKVFTTFRLAYNDSWTDQSGQRHESVQWFDCIISDRPAVVDYIKQGVAVLVEYCAIRTRVYSSPKDRCMKAGLTLSVVRVELLGGAAPVVPRQLVDSNGVVHKVTQFFHTDCNNAQLMATRGNRLFVSDDNGWVTPVSSSEDGQPSDGEVNERETDSTEPF